MNYDRIHSAREGGVDTKLQIIDVQQCGFHSAVEYGSWRVAIFNEDVRWKAENIKFLQKHDLTDEVFILLNGECILLLCDDGDIETIYGVEMKRGCIYNVPKGVWHSHILKECAKIIVIENSDTTPENSPTIALPQPPDLNTLCFRQIDENYGAKRG